MIRVLGSPCRARPTPGYTNCRACACCCAEAGRCRQGCTTTETTRKRGAYSSPACQSTSMAAKLQSLPLSTGGDSGGMMLVPGAVHRGAHGADGSLRLLIVACLRNNPRGP